MNGPTQVRIDNREGVLVAALEGEIDLTNAAEIRQELLAAIPNAADGLIVDLTALTYLDSRGIHLLFEVKDRLQARRQSFRLVVPESSPLRRLLALTSLDRLVPVDPTVAEAVANMRPEEGRAGPSG